MAVVANRSSSRDIIIIEFLQQITNIVNIFNLLQIILMAFPFLDVIGYHTVSRYF